MWETYSDRAKRVCGPARPARRGCGQGGGVCWRWRAEPVPREGFKMEIDFEFQMNLDFGKTLWNFTKRFRRNLDMRIFFLNYSRLLKDF
jgi:hypothetical protein